MLAAATAMLPVRTLAPAALKIIVPRFRENDFYGGIDAGVARMIRVMDGEPLPPVQRGGAGDARGQAVLL